jgi:arylsulfatase A-like enzyme
VKKLVSNTIIGFSALASITSCINTRDVINKPNVILVLTDDQGYGTLSCNGNPFIETPQIDKIYNESVRLTNFHVSPVCSPTRAALLTGKYPNRSGIWRTFGGRSIMNKDEVTLAQVFEENGYTTGLFGKWHLGDNYPYRPQDRGFKEVLSFGGGGVGQIPDYWGNDYFDDVYLHNGKHEFYKGYCTDVWFENAMSFIEEHNSRKTGKPFFCYLATNAPHFWYFVPNSYTLPFREKGMGDELSRYLGMVANIDENMGKLCKKLEELSLKENTILIFMSDNGQSNYKLPTSGPFYYNAGMRGVKGSAYDGGHRQFCYIRWPKGGIKGGKDISQLAAHIDIMPTLIELCHLRNKHTIDFDGKSLVPLLKDNRARWNERTLFVDFQNLDTVVKWRNSAVMTEKYRLINGKELYDIKKDPSQRMDIADTFPAVVEKLRKEYDFWWEHISDRFSSYSRLYLGDDHENPTELSCMDMHGKTATWDPEAVRNRQLTNGFWAVEIVRDGEYEFTCRTYPKEEDTRLNVVKVRLKIGDKEIEKDCDPGTSEVKVKLNLKAGEAFMQSWFYESDGNNYGVPFIYIKRY